MAQSEQVRRPLARLEGTDLGDEYLFYDRQRDQVHVLNATAREVYLLCDGRRTEDEVMAVFAEQYEVSAETAQADAREILRRLEELGMLQFSS